MSRRWFWPLVSGGVLLFSLASGFLWSVLLLYRADPTAELPRRIDDYSDSTVVHAFYVDVNPAVYVIAGLSAAVGVLLFVAASRLR